VEFVSGGSNISPPGYNISPLGYSTIEEVISLHGGSGQVAANFITF
jgi:hypothetical protein